MNKIKKFFIHSGIILLTFIQVLFIVLFSVLTWTFWKKFFSFFKFKRRKKVVFTTKVPTENSESRVIPDFDRTYTITIINKNKSEKITDEAGRETDKGDTPITLFGFNQFWRHPRLGLPEGIDVSVGESSYDEMMIESATSPFIISGFRMSSANAQQLDQVLNIIQRTGNGQRASFPLQVGNYFSAFQFQALIREVYPYNITFTGATQISFTMFAETTLVMMLFVGKRVNIGDELKTKEISVHKLPFVARQHLSLSPATVLALGGNPETSVTKNILKSLR